ncbi:DUF305 domain-containing protein, partial [Streptomyces noursei]|uniref:DUF305 domain-containing protein n=1 Tax=Streptomyces noursei TaxID=1971 RepID=UPI00344FB720
RPATKKTTPTKKTGPARPTAKKTAPAKKTPAKKKTPTKKTPEPPRGRAKTSRGRRGAAPSAQAAAALPKPAVTFLSAMAKHHRMGIPMCETYLRLDAADQAPKVTKLARTILGQLRSQADEMDEILTRHRAKSAKGPAAKK